MSLKTSIINYYVCIVCGKLFKDLGKEKKKIHCQHKLRAIPKEEYKRLKNA